MGAVDDSRISRILGYKIEKGDFRTTTPNLPQRIAVFGEANWANQGTLSLTPTQYTSAQAVGNAYGYGSPLYLMARILFPKQGGGVSGIPVVFYPQATPNGASEKIFTITPTGTATDSGTHYVKVAGRDNLDGDFYAINIVQGDSSNQITAKITDVLSNVLGCPFTVTDDDYVNTLTSKWRGATANDLQVDIDLNGKSLGITYTVQATQSGAGTPSVTAQLNNFGNEWNTIVVNPYAENTQIMTQFEQFNGRPDPDSPTGRYLGIVMKPFIAITGTTSDDPSPISDARPNDVTIAFAPAPNSPGLPLEASANMAVEYAKISQNEPNLDVAGKFYNDMPTPTAIGSMASYDNRDAMVKKGCSTVDLVAGQYQIQDFVTTYHPLGENPPQFRYCRNLMLDFNVRYGYYLLEQINVVDHSIAQDMDIVNAAKVIKPKQWVQILNQYAEDLVNRGLITDAAFMAKSIIVSIGTTNPDRFQTSFSYKRTGFARVLDTVATAGFNFGNL